MQNIRLKLKDLYLPYMASFSAGVITPGRLGEFVKVLFLKEMGCPLGKSILNTLLDRLMDIAFMIFFGCIGLLIIYQSKYFQTIFLLLILITLSILFLMKNFKKDKSSTKMRKQVISPLLPQIVLEKIVAYTKVVREELRCIKLLSLGYAGIVTMLSWLLYFSQMHLLILALEIDLSPLNTAIFVTISSLLGLLPITFLGIGTRDAVLIYLFKLQGLSAELAVAFSGLILTLILINAAAAAVISMTLLPVEMREIRVKSNDAILRGDQ